MIKLIESFSFTLITQIIIVGTLVFLAIFNSIADHMSNGKVSIVQEVTDLSIKHPTLIFVIGFVIGHFFSKINH